MYQDIDGEDAGDWSGYSVSLSSDGTIVAIGAIYNNISKGQCRVYQLGLTGSNPGSTGWVQLGQDIDGEAVGDNSGFSVSLSSNGTMVAVGAPCNNLGKGQCRVYQLPITTTTTIDSDVIELGTESSTTTIYGNLTIPNAIQVQVINTTSGDVVSTIDPNACITATLFISPTANQTGRKYILPTNCPIGFLLTIKNSSGVIWTFETESGIIYAYDSPCTNSFSIDTTVKCALQYLGNITTDGLTYHDAWSV